ncbi:MAG: AIR synthase family protein [Chloroflexota bacterium]|nr:AIR synthase family protein [Chloroflexota bacterium]MDE2684421.1 AIR synthase family protein [Chloroflexota bacterium]
MKPGKLPPDLLAELLPNAGTHDSRVLVGPAVGEDCAVVEMGDRLLVAKSDPITFAAERVGWYAVQVNANDIACAGAEPKWFLPTLLLPAHFTPDDVRAIFLDISNACSELGAAIIGGHSEVTLGIDRPIVAGTMLGELLNREQLVTTAGARDGDSVILSTGVAIEGTAILATECAEELRQAGVDTTTIERAAGYLHEPGISVVKAAQALCGSVDVHSLHDITEGGIVTALREVATASNLGVVFEAESTPVLPECAAICEALGVNPIGLLGSGALLATMPAIDAPRALRALDSVGVNGWEIGQMIEEADGMWLIDRTGEHMLPEFIRDELARYLDERGAQSPR